MTNSTYLEAFLLHLKSLKAYLNLDKKKLLGNLSIEEETLFPILQDTIKKSFFGPAFSDNLIRFLNIKILFTNIESPLRCFYLYENQSWEKVVNSEFKNISPTQKTIGVLHSTVRFWDLRFAQPHYADKPHSDLLYNPDYFAINGFEAMSQYKNAGFESDRLIEVESLRYLYLIDIAQNLQKDTSDLEHEEISILVFGDYSPILNNKMIIFLEHCDKIISNPIKFIFKSHINAPIDISRYAFRNAALTKERNENLFANYRNCFFSNMTSAQVDAIYFNIDPMIYMDASELNLSPLRERENANFIFTPNDLLHACISGNSLKDPLKPNSKNFLYLDKDLKKWKSLISTKL
jgi:surface carbohydrate biosynthesis protein (TIGR04326 family)